MLPELNTCPFCGGHAVMCSDGPIDQADGDAWYYVMCDNCEAKSSSYSDRSDAAEAWNQRA